MLQPLTAREAAVLAAVRRRLTNTEIAAEFTVPVRTVESHIAALRRKLDTLRRLVPALWSAGEHRAAAVESGRLSVLDPAAPAPAGLRPRWDTTLAEGRARESG